METKFPPSVHILYLAVPYLGGKKKLSDLDILRSICTMMLPSKKPIRSTAKTPKTHFASYM